MNSLQHLRQLFERCLDLPEGERDAWLEREVDDSDLRIELGLMLAADGHGDGFLDHAVAEHIHGMLDPDATFAPVDLVGHRFGAFRLVRLLGQGGQATVYLAERDAADFRQSAAVKLLRRGLHDAAEHRQFRRERDILARLEHPDIARLIDGGVSPDGVPYLVMEFVDGVAIDVWCREQALDRRARVALFVRICRAVDAAHRALIVHADLKPSNVLVARTGQVKVLDFGIARLLVDEAGDATATAMRRLTPGYAAPEQERGEAITLATDVYALGVVLAELLRGERAQRARTGDTPTLPTGTPRDLFWIIGKACADEPERRYRSAAEFADDAQRWLDGAPVQAHPPSPSYRARKFVARHRASVATATLLLLILLAATMISLIQARRAEREAQRATAVRDFLLEALDAAKAVTPQEQKPTVDALAHKAVERLDQDRALDELTRADILHTMAVVASAAYDYDAAMQHIDRALAIRTRLLPVDNPDLLLSHVQRATFLSELGEHSQAEATLQPLQALLRTSESEAGILGLELLGWSADQHNRSDEALSLAREAIAKSTRVFGAQARQTLTMRLRVSSLVSSDARRQREAAAELAATIAQWRANGFAVDTTLIGGMNNLLMLREELGEAPDALERYQEILALDRSIHSGAHLHIALSLSAVATALAERGRYDEAAGYFDQSLAMRRVLHSGAHASIVNALNQSALNESRRGQPVAAERFVDEALALCATAERALEVLCTRTAVTQGWVVLHAGRPAQALAMLSAALSATRRLHDEPSDEVAIALGYLAEALLAVHRPAEALAHIDTAIIVTSIDTPLAPFTLLARTTRAEALLELDRDAAAMVEIDAVLALGRARNDQNPARLARRLLLKAEIAEHQRDPVAAFSAASEAAELAVAPSLLPERAQATLTRLAPASGRTPAR